MPALGAVDRNTAGVGAEPAAVRRRSPAAPSRRRRRPRRATRPRCTPAAASSPTLGRRHRASSRSTADPAPVRWVPPAVELPPLSVGRVRPQLDLAWRRTSYSALTAAVHDGPRQRSPSDGRAASRRNRSGPTRSAAPAASTRRTPADDQPRRAPRPAARRWRDLPAGTDFGTLVHAVLENVDTSAADLAARAARPVLPRRWPRATAATSTRGAGRRAAAGARHPARPARRRAAAAGHRPPRPARRDGLRAAAGRRRPAARAATRTLADVAALLRRHLPGGRPARRLRRPARRARAGRTAAARLPHRQHRRGAPGPRRRRPAALPHRRLQDELARRR